MLVIFSVYLLLAFSSFFFTGAADQSIIDSGNSADLAAVNNNVKNYAGSRGAQLASYLINDCFGISSFFIPCLFGGGRIEADAGAHCPSVEMVYRLYIIIGVVLRVLRFRFDGSLSGFFHLSGRYARLQCKPMAGFAGGSSRSMDDPADNGCLLLYIYKCTDDNLVAQTFLLWSFLKRQKKEEEKETAEEGTQEFTTSQPQEVEFNLKRTYKQNTSSCSRDGYTGRRTERRISGQRTGTGRRTSFC